MNVQELKYILCIARHQNLTKAAQELYISQPTLSKFLQRMERELDGKLFSRAGNQYVPTYLGRRYMEYARKMLAVSQDWERELSDLNACREGELNIALPLMRSSCIIPEILPIFHRKYPGVKVNLLEETHAIQEKLLQDEQLDFGVFNESEPHPKLTYELLAKEQILLVMSGDHPLAKKAIRREGFRYPWIDLGLFGEEAFILHPKEQTTGRIALEQFEAYGIAPPVLIHTRSTQSSILLAEQGMGVCFVPENYVKSMQPAVTPACFSIGETGIYSNLSIAYRKGAYLPVYAQDFIEIARDSINKEEGEETCRR